MGVSREGTETLILHTSFPVVNPAAVAAKSLQSRLTLWDPIDGNTPGSSLPGTLQQEYWSGLPFASLWKLPDPGIEPECLESPALAG